MTRSYIVICSLWQPLTQGDPETCRLLSNTIPATAEGIQSEIAIESKDRAAKPSIVSSKTTDPALIPMRPSQRPKC